jgi:hypothetical protein
MPVAPVPDAGGQRLGAAPALDSVFRMIVIGLAEPFWVAVAGAAEKS